MEDETKQLEGYDQDAQSIEDFPIDSLMIRTEVRSVFEISRRIESGQYIMDPDFQRDFVWKVDKQSKLIESAILRIPLPVFYLSETDEGKLVVVDGLQRLTTFHRFLKGKFSLKDLHFDKSLNGKYFKDLNQNIQNRIEDTQLTLYLIDSQVNAGAKYEIFERVNGGVPLTRQQMRNCLFNGKATQWLKIAVDFPEFIAATDNGLDSSSMRDRECVNRFLAFQTKGWKDYSGNMDSYLDEALKGVNTACRERPSYSDSLTSVFKNSMKINYELFGKNAFRKSFLHGGRRSVINVSLFDVLSCYFTDRYYEEALAKKEEIRSALRTLLSNEEFKQAITYSTNSKTVVKKRFQMLEEAFDTLNLDLDI